MTEKSFNRRAVRDYVVSPSGGDDILDLDNGTMLIHRRNVKKYLEQYGCPNAETLSDVMWFNYGMYCKIID